MTMPSEDQHELDWQAFCYISDELSDGDRAQFELCLASDQETREAVARAVQLAETLAVAEISPACRVVRLKPATRWLTLAVATSTVAAALMVVLLYQLVWRPAEKNGSVENEDQRHGAVADLAEAWHEMRQEFDTDDGLADAWDGRVELPMAEPWGTESVEDVEASSWILTAVENLPEVTEGDVR